MSSPVSAAAPASAAAPVSAASITVQLLTGDRLEVEVSPQESYRRLYDRVWDQLPEDLRCGERCGMNLLLDGELVPISHEPAIISQEIYHLLMDPIRYDITIHEGASYAVDNNHLQGEVYHVWGVVVHVLDVEPSRWEMGTILYAENTGRYHPLEENRHEWVYQPRYDRYMLNVWIEHDKEQMSATSIVEHLMGQVEEALHPSLAGKRHIQELLEANIITMEEAIRHE